jgi:fumarate reductase flavoprotein subunit
MLPLRVAGLLRETGRAPDDPATTAQAEAVVKGVRDLLLQKGDESLARVRREMRNSLEEGAGIYREEASTGKTCETVAELKQRFGSIEVNDKSNVFNTDLQQALELRNLLDIAETVAEGSLQRRESRGAHQRLDFPERDDTEFLRHSLAFRQPDSRPRIEWLDVTITRSQPGVRDYSGGKS